MSTIRTQRQTHCTACGRPVLKVQIIRQSFTKTLILQRDFNRAHKCLKFKPTDVLRGDDITYAYKQGWFKEPFDKTLDA